MRDFLFLSLISMMCNAAELRKRDSGEIERSSSAYQLPGFSKNVDAKNKENIKNKSTLLQMMEEKELSLIKKNFSLRHKYFKLYKSGTETIIANNEKGGIDWIISILPNGTQRVPVFKKKLEEGSEKPILEKGSEIVPITWDEFPLEQKEREFIYYAAISLGIHHRVSLTHDSKKEGIKKALIEWDKIEKSRQQGELDEIFHKQTRELVEDLRSYYAID